MHRSGEFKSLCYKKSITLLRLGWHYYVSSRSPCELVLTSRVVIHLSLLQALGPKRSIPETDFITWLVQNETGIKCSYPGCRLP
jgi:hypothetical protein